MNDCRLFMVSGFGVLLVGRGTKTTVGIRFIGWSKSHTALSSYFKRALWTKEQN